MVYLKLTMKFLREDRDKAEAAIVQSLCDGLEKGERVLWLVSGGSNIQAEKLIMDALSERASDKLGGLAILPMDERFGESGHKDSNSEQLRKAGFNPGKGTWIDILMHNLPFDQTLSFYSDVSAAAFSNADTIVGQFGMGSDGHIAGIKPFSPATDVDESTVAGYEWEDYDRMTLAAASLRQITHSYLLAYGKDKKKPLQQLMKKTSTFKRLPAVLLCDLPDVYVYNDQIESEG